MHNKGMIGDIHYDPTDVDITGGTIKDTIVSGVVTKLSPNLLIVQSGQTIQSVIDSITDAAADNPYVVRLPPGVWEEKLVLKSYIDIVGSGKTKSILRGTAAINDYLITDIADHCSISHLQVDANLECGGITVDGNNIKLNSVYVKDIKNLVAGIHDHGIGIIGGSNITITESILENPYDDGIGIDEGSPAPHDVIIANNLFVDCDRGSTSSGIEVNDGAHDITIEGNIVLQRDQPLHDGGGGVCVKNHAGKPRSYGVSIVGNVCDSVNVWCSGAGSEHMRGITVSNNVVRAIRMYRTEDFVIANNIVKNNASSNGIHVDYGERFSVTGNRISWICSRGLLIDNSINFSVQNNTCFACGNSSKGLEIIDSSYFDVVGNYAYEYLTLPTSVIASEAAAGQKDITVNDGSIFEVGMDVNIVEGGNDEVNTIEFINSDVLTMTTNLSHTYSAGDVTKGGMTFAIIVNNDCNHFFAAGNVGHNCTRNFDIGTTNVTEGVLQGNTPPYEKTVTGVVTLNPIHPSKLNSSGGAVTATLPDGFYIGQREHIVMIVATTSSTVVVTHHADGDGIVGTFDAVDEVWILEWSGTEWVTIKATCTFV